MNNNSNDLKTWDEVWGDTKTEQSKSKGNFETVPDGKYVVKIDRLEQKTSKAGNIYFSWGLAITEGSRIGEWIWKNSMITDQRSVGFFKDDLVLLGHVPGKLSDINLEAYLDLRLEVNVKTKGDFTNVYFNKLIDGDYPEVSEDETGVPF